MATLFLHIGHGKTGSSWIQSSMRMSRYNLKDQNIVYAKGSDAKIIDSKTISSGNAIDLFMSKSIFEETLAKHRPDDRSSLLFSSEYLFKQMIDQNAEKFIASTALRYGFDKVSILLFIRNPIGSAISVWQQRIKRKGYYKVSLADLHKHSDICYDKILNVSRFLDQFSKLISVEITIKNYSISKNRLLDEVSSWLNVPNEVLQTPPVSRINRSMTYSELIMQQNLNRILGSSGRLLSDPLCEQLPDINPSQLLPPLCVQKIICTKLLPTIEHINKQLPKIHQYQYDIQLPKPKPNQLYFSEEQVKTITKSLGEEILYLRKELKNLKP
jgi:hypothetical protein